MMADILSDLRWADNWVLYAVIAAGAVATITAFLVGRRLTSRTAPAADTGKVELANEPDPYDTPSKAERRQVMRRKGATVEVEIVDGEQRQSPQEGWVQDRSIGGLGLVGLRSIEPGTRLKVRPKHAAPLTPWVDVEVRSCQHGESDYWLIGCAFVKSPPYSILLMFG